MQRCLTKTEIVIEGEETSRLFGAVSARGSRQICLSWRPTSTCFEACGDSGTFLETFPRCPHNRETLVRNGSVAVWGWNGSSGSGFWFRRFLCKKGFSVFQYSLTKKDGSGSGFGSWKTVPAVPVPVLVSGTTVPMAPVSGSSSVPEPPCHNNIAEIQDFHQNRLLQGWN